MADQLVRVTGWEGGAYADVLTSIGKQSREFVKSVLKSVEPVLAGCYSIIQ